MSVSRRDLLLLGVAAPLAGLSAGLIGTAFRLALEKATALHQLILSQLHGQSAGWLVAMLLCALITACAAWIVRRFAPEAAGSGIPRVISVIEDQLPPARARVIPAKFTAGTLAIGAGLALGREGPSVQMGASLAYHTGRLLRLEMTDCRILLAAGAGAGFASAFNAPLAGALFVLEALVRRFEPRIAIAALAASAVAISTGRALAGNVQDFTLPPLSEPTLPTAPLYLLLGASAGLAGMFYTRMLTRGLALAQRWPVAVEIRAACVGAGLGAVAWFAPELAGGGEALAQQALNGTGSLTLLPLLFILRLGLIVVSVASGAPGGLLVPFLALGAELGLWFGSLGLLAWPSLGLSPPSFAVVGMAALFAAIIRSPLTAIVLVTEISGSITLLLPMIAACSAAMLLPQAASSIPLLERLRHPSALTAPPARQR